MAKLNYTFTLRLMAHCVSKSGRTLTKIVYANFLSADKDTWKVHVTYLNHRPYETFTLPKNVDYMQALSSKAYWHPHER